MDVSLVIPNWNGAEKIKKNLPRVLRTEGVGEFIVCDDASSDESVDILKKEFPEVKLIIRDKNGGFSSNVNTGVSYAKGELIFLLNSDAVPEKDCLKFVLPHFINPQVFSVSFNTGGSWSWANIKNGFFWHYMSDKKVTTAHQTLWASGGSMIFRRDVWDMLGGFDELFNPFYEEDVDLGYRANKRGYINLWEPKAKVEHYKQVGVIAQHFSKSTVAKTAQRNQLIFIWKNITNEFFFAEHKKTLLKWLLTKPGYWPTFLRAFLRRGEIMKKRMVGKDEEIVSDEEILSRFN